MKWPWVKRPENRGTLTLLPRGQAVLGFPAGYPSTPEMADEAARHLADWVLHGSLGSIVFRFPVDVEDKRWTTPPRRVSLDDIKIEPS